MSARRSWARPLVPVYAMALRMKEALLRMGFFKRRQLQWPVISVGSLSAGGAGKTPVVIALAKLLAESRWSVDVLTRGYGREGRSMERVQPEVDGASRRFGDEPTLIAQRVGVPVWVGAVRFRAGEGAEAERSLGERLTNVRSVHLLDDGFQHRQLARAMDIVLVTAEDLDDMLLPAGNLREGFSALRRADVIVVRQDEVEDVGKRVWAQMREGAQMWAVRRALRFPAPLFVFGAGLRPMAFCAIARPEGFAAMLQDAGCGIVETIAFEDHHRFAITDMERVIAVAKGVNASGFVTTEKDAVKLTQEMRARLEEVGPLMIVALDAVFDDKQAVMSTIEMKLFGSSEVVAS